MISTVLLGLTTAGLISLNFYNFRKQSQVRSKRPKGDLPTVSLLIPARNETHAIANNLHRALSLDYPKLEIIVLDDESRDNTPEKIRSFAQDGVRFVEGRSLPQGWVGKNWASHQLSEAASGEYLVFCDTDVLLNSRGFNLLMNEILTSGISSASVLPRLLFMNTWHSFAYPVLHWLLLTLRQDGNKSYPAYGGLMIFEAGAYRQHGGYSRYQDRVLPELKIAQDFAKQRSYHFFNTSGFGFELLKKASSLIESRTRYLRPLYRHFPGLGLVHIVITLLPVVLLATGSWWLYLPLALAFGSVNWRQSNRPFMVGLMLPLICITEFTLLFWSYLQHSRSTIAWKQREVS